MHHQNATGTWTWPITPSPPQRAGQSDSPNKISRLDRIDGIRGLPIIIPLFTFVQSLALCLTVLPDPYLSDP